MFFKDRSNYDFTKGISSQNTDQVYSTEVIYRVSHPIPQGKDDRDISGKPHKSYHRS